MPPLTRAQPECEWLENSGAFTRFCGRAAVRPEGAANFQRIIKSGESGEKQKAPLRGICGLSGLITGTDRECSVVSGLEGEVANYAWILATISSGWTTFFSCFSFRFSLRVWAGFFLFSCLPLSRLPECGISSSLSGLHGMCIPL